MANQNKVCIFFDTNIIQHIITHPESSEILDLHKKNKEFYSKSNNYILPQVYNELTEHNIDRNCWLWELIKLELLNHDYSMKYFINLYSDLYDYLLKVLDLYSKYQKLTDPEVTDCQQIISISNGYFFLSTLEANTLEFLKIWTWKDIAKIKELIDENNINYNQLKTTDDSSRALATIIEKTLFWDKLCLWYTHKDHNRFIGNFSFDYKNFLGKKPTQQLKVHKDSHVFLDMIMAMPQINSNNLVFISSDYWFIKELNKFLYDQNQWLLDWEYYKDLSPVLLWSIKILCSKLRILKLDVIDLLFENSDGKESQLISDLIT